jgi:mRNA-degrading endonuclease toxin of MazEF toxin-antitoxin module
LAEPTAEDPPRARAIRRRIVVPTTTRLVDTMSPLRLRLPAGAAGLERESDVLVAQLIAIANESFRKELGVLPGELFDELSERLRIVLGL